MVLLSVGVTANCYSQPKHTTELNPGNVSSILIIVKFKICEDNLLLI